LIIKWITKLCVSHVIANSEASASALRTLAKLRAGKISVVYNGIDATSFDAAAMVPVAKLRARYQLPEDAFLIGCFSRLAHWKGQHVLLQALEAIPNAHAVIVGSALFGEDEYAALLQQQADVPALRGRVHFLGFQADVASLMVAMDVVVHTSIAPEPFGRVIVEAMLAKRPIVASRAGGALEIITDGVDGRLVEPDNSAALASAINNLRATPDATEAIVSQGYLRAKDFFGPVAYCVSVLGRLEKIGGIKISATPVLSSVVHPPCER
jgi:glycosyltransferase involved in cell wall biosynthesis